MSCKVEFNFFSIVKNSVYLLSKITTDIKYEKTSVSDKIVSAATTEARQHLHLKFVHLTVGRSLVLFRIIVFRLEPFNPVL